MLGKDTEVLSGVDSAGGGYGEGHGRHDLYPIGGGTRHGDVVKRGSQVAVWSAHAAVNGKGSGGPWWGECAEEVMVSS